MALVVNVVTSPQKKRSLRGEKVIRKIRFETEIKQRIKELEPTLKDAESINDTKWITQIEAKLSILRWVLGEK